MSVASAAQGPATVYLTTYLRSGPGPQYAALDEVPPHSQVEVESCDTGWCRVRSGRATGFIEAGVLSAPDIHANPPPPPPGASCFTARLNGRPRGGDDVRICGEGR